MTRNDHLTVEEITQYLDTSDLSEEYLLRMEEISEHLLSCDQCQRSLRKALSVESIFEEGGLSAGLRLLEKEEKIIGEINEKLEKELGKERKADEDRSEI